MPYFESSSGRMYYQEEGKGDPLVLIMGLGCPSSLWFGQVPDLARSYRVITFDNLGIGRSDKPKGPYTVELLAGATAELLRGLAATPAHVVGVSMGGTVGQRLAVDHPDVVNKLVLVGTWARTGRYGRELLRAWREIAQDGGMELLVRLNLAQYLTPRAYEQPQLVDKLRELFDAGEQPVECYNAQSLACEGHSALHLLETCRSETLVIAGNRDGQTPVSAAKEIAARIPKSELAVMDGVGHGAMWQDPASFNATVSEFLGRP